MTLNQLTYFCMLAKTQSYTQAAQALFIAQPSSFSSVEMA